MGSNLYVAAAPTKPAPLAPGLYQLDRSTGTYAPVAVMPTGDSFVIDADGLLGTLTLVGMVDATTARSIVARVFPGRSFEVMDFDVHTAGGGFSQFHLAATAVAS